MAAWAAWRWLGLFAGIPRIRRLQGPARREGRRAAVTRTAMNVFWSVAALYAWTAALRLQPTEQFVGFIGALLMVSLAAAVLAAFMQPAERTPESLDLFRIRPRPDDTPPRE